MTVVLLSVVTMLLAASRMAIIGCEANGDPATAANDGCVWIASFTGVPGVTLKLWLVAVAKPVALAVSCLLPT